MLRTFDFTPTARGAADATLASRMPSTMFPFAGIPARSQATDATYGANVIVSFGGLLVSLESNATPSMTSVLRMTSPRFGTRPFTQP